MRRIAIYSNPHYGRRQNIFGEWFEMPVLAWFFAKMGFLSADFMRRHRKHTIVIILVIAAVIIPTSDVFTLSFVALPMWLLYEASSCIVKRAKTNCNE